MWNDGYVTSLTYTAGYYAELNPNHIRLALLNAGLKGPPSEDFRYLELGFGQGLSLAIHSAAHEGEFWGIDFNPAHASVAQELIAASGAPATVLDHSFAELAARTDAPDFDIIALHGIWSWISPENQRVIVDVLRRKLKPGGVVYISYNCWPGHAASAPLRHLLMLHNRYEGRESEDLPGRINASITFAEQMNQANAQYFQGNPRVQKALEVLKTRDRRYLAHEYFNADWRPMPFSAVADQLAEAKLSFAASAVLLEHFERLHLTPEGLKLLQGISNREFRESVRDYLTNAQFRRDYFVRGLRRMSALEQVEGFRALRIVLEKPPEDIELRVKTPLGELSLNRSTFDPLIEALARHAPGPVPWSSLERAVAGRLTFQQLRDALVILVGSGHAQVAHDEAAVERVQERTRRLGRFLLRKASASGEFAYLPSPVTGAGVRVNRAEQWFLRALDEGHGSAPSLARAAWAVLSQTGERLTKDGKAFRTEAENLAELEAQAQSFLDKRLASLKALGVCGPAAP